ncbi:hypothetical protein DdX_19659 [Ditylenchus destructor]|uniref:Glycosyltransferase 2-like domain-containing protein n=1 Tax=Ditylenchus destructor TaxID=166010 RepID=A0AAD4MIG8_9BILA|nr:hypothetical protein DdX_19659 [Ditylenchus destructor]
MCRATTAGTSNYQQQPQQTDSNKWRRISLQTKSVVESSRRRLSSYKGRLEKPANRYIRWNLLFTFLILLFLTSAVWIPCIPMVQKLSMEIAVVVIIILHFLWLIALFNNVRYLIRMKRYKSHIIDLKKSRTNGKVIKHLVGICFYKEPMELMIDTLNSIAVQPDAELKISVFVGLEQGTPDKEKKEAELRTRFETRFERFFVTIHPKSLPGDIPGKCSNLNYAARKAVKMLREDEDYGYGPAMEILITTGDCDTVFGERYFDALEEDYWKVQPEARYLTVWQSPLFYCINLDKSPFFVRVTGLLRSFFMMGYLIPWNINTMSVFSLTLKLFEDGEYTHPGYQMEDIIALIRWTCSVGQKCIIRMIPVATLSGPTSGSSYLNELYEWARQIRRWTIGAAEVFHYFMIKSNTLPFVTSLTWAIRFLFYYGFVLCIGSLYPIIAPFTTVQFLILTNHPVEGLLIPNQMTFQCILLGLLGLQYFWFLSVFVVNKLAEDVFPDGRKDETGFIRNVFHWIMTWPTITAYCCIEMAAFFEVTFRGKDVCSHSASKKDGLVQKNNNVAVHPISIIPDRTDPFAV